VCFGPNVVDLFPDDRPVLYARSRCRYLQCVLLYGPDEIVNGASKGVHQDRSRCDDQEAATDDHNGRGEALFSADPARERPVQWVERNRQNERPGHQRQERRKDDVAQPGQHADQPGPNQHILKAGCDPPFEFVVRLPRAIHEPSRREPFPRGARPLRIPGRQRELATGVVILPQRQTALVAMQAAAVHRLTGAAACASASASAWNHVEYPAT
jgi:hypothetical protein